MRASIALATFNGAVYLPEQLASLANQTVAPFELVVCDDHSTDGTVEIVRAFARSCPFPVRIVLNARQLGYRHNFMQAAGACAGDVVLFCDQDDLWQPDKIAAVLDAFQADPGAQLVYHNAATVDRAGQRLGRLFDPATEAAALARDLPLPWHFAPGLVQAFRGDLRRFDALWPASREHFAAEDPISHDRWYFMLALAQGGVRFLDRELLRYRQHDSNTFGAEPGQGPIRRIVQRLRVRPAMDRYWLAGARSRADAIRAALPAMDPAGRARAEAYAGAYADLADRIARRCLVYDSPAMRARTRAFLSLLANGDYGGLPWRFNPLAIGRDILHGIFLRG